MGRERYPLSYAQPIEDFFKMLKQRANINSRACKVWCLAFYKVNAKLGTNDCAKTLLAFKANDMEIQEAKQWEESKDRKEIKISDK